MVRGDITKLNDGTFPELNCQSVVWRVAKFPDWIDKQRTRLTPRAFRRQGPKGHLPAEKGISVVPQGTCSPEQAVQNAGGGDGIGTLLVGYVVELGLSLDRDKVTHAHIMGMPLPGDAGGEDGARGLHLRTQLAMNSRMLDWRP